MDDIIKKLELVSINLLIDDYDNISKTIELMMTEIVSIIPIIFKIYLTKDIAECNYEMGYWPNEIEKILGLIGKQDRFALFDALYFELRGGFINLNNVCNKYGIELG